MVDRATFVNLVREVNWMRMSLILVRVMEVVMIMKVHSRRTAGLLRPLRRLALQLLEVAAAATVALVTMEVVVMR